MTDTIPAHPLFGQRPPSTSTYKFNQSSSGITPKDHSGDYVIGVTAAAIILVGVCWFARMKWVQLRPKQFARPAVVAERERPGFVAENLAPERWEKSLGVTLKEAESTLLADGSPISAKAAAAIRETVPLLTTVATLTRQAVTVALESGAPQSWLLSATPTAVSALVCPARHAHARLIRKHGALADGWLEYASQLQRGLAKNGSPPDVLCLVIFLGPDARDGSLAVAFEAAEGRLATADLVDGDASDDGRPLRRVGSWGLQFAAPAEERAYPISEFATRIS